MGKSYWEKEPWDLAPSELIAYTLAKMRPFEQSRIMDPSCECPVTFAWRFHNAEGGVYSTLKACVTSFSGNVKWVMYGGDASGINYVIEPAFVYELRERVGPWALRETLSADYKGLCTGALADIAALCSRIEDTFALANVTPMPPFRPSGNR